MEEKVCPMCPNHCPVDALKCGRGRAHFGSAETAAAPSEPQREEGRHDRSGRGDHRRHGMSGGHLRESTAKDTDPTITLLRQCGYLLYHGEGEGLLSCLSDLERAQLQALLRKCLDSQLK